MKAISLHAKLLVPLLCAFILSGCGGSSPSADPDSTPDQNILAEDQPESPNFEGDWVGLLSTPVQIDAEVITITRRYSFNLVQNDKNTYSGSSAITSIDSQVLLAEYSIVASFSDNLLVVTETSLLENELNKKARANRISNPPSELECLSEMEFQVEVLGDGYSLQQNPSTSADICGRGELSASNNIKSVELLWHELLPHCPCMFPEADIENAVAVKDRVSRSGVWKSLDVNDKYHPGASFEARWVPKDSGTGQQCTYNSDKQLITGGLGAGTPDTRSPGANWIDFVSNPANVAVHNYKDVWPFGETSCSNYLSKFPPNNGNSCPSMSVTLVPPRAGLDQSCESIIANGPLSELPLIPVGGDDPIINDDPISEEVAVSSVSYTDPHLVTLDGLGYGFQAVGEFTLLKSEVDGLEIQARQARYGERTSQASVNIGFAFNVHGTAVSLVESPANELTAYVNGEARSGEGVIDFTEGGSIDIGTDVFEITWSDGSRAVVKDRVRFLNLSLGLSVQHAGRTSGLLGNSDGDRNNDLTTASGRDLSTNPNAGDLYGEYADSWRVSDETSLFHYLEGQSTEFFTDLLFPSNAVTFTDLDESDIALPRVQCELAGVTNTQLLENCILDLVLSGDTVFLAGITDIQESSMEGVVNANVVGEVGVASLACDEEPVTASYRGSFTNPDAGLMWQMDLDLAWCDDIVAGKMIIISDDWEQRRRIRGKWVLGELNLSASYPYNPTGSSSNIRSACFDVVLSLAGELSTLSGTWVAANCRLGGEITLVQNDN